MSAGPINSCVSLRQAPLSRLMVRCAARSGASIWPTQTRAAAFADRSALLLFSNLSLLTMQLGLTQRQVAEVLGVNRVTRFGIGRTIGRSRGVGMYPRIVKFIGYCPYNA